MKRNMLLMNILIGYLFVGFLGGCGGGGGGAPAEPETGPNAEEIPGIPEPIPGAGPGTPPGGDSGAGIGTQAVISKSTAAGLSVPAAVFFSFNSGSGFSSQPATGGIQKLRQGLQGFSASLHPPTSGHDGSFSEPDVRECQDGGTETTTFDFESGTGTTARVECLLGNETHNTVFQFETVETQDCSDLPFLGIMPKVVRVTSNGTIDIETERTTLADLLMEARFLCEDFNIQDTITLDSTLISGSISVVNSAAPAENTVVTFDSMTITGLFNETEDAIQMNGNVSVSLLCDGVETSRNLTLVTEAPIVTPPGDNTACPIGGVIVLSGDVNTTITHQADGSVDVGARHFDSCKELDAICSE